MFESKYSSVLTVILVIVIVAIIILLGFLGYDLVTKYLIEKEASAFVENFTASTNTTTEDDENIVENTTENSLEDSKVDLNDVSASTNTTTSTTTVPQYNGYDMVGTMEIPAIDFSYPILANANNKSLEVSVGFLYGVGINQPGNTVISGHNYRNGLFFSNNKKLELGDKIYITDNSGNKLTYTIYDKFETTPEDVDFYVRDTNNVPEITLTTCTDDSSARLIILARAE